MTSYDPTTLTDCLAGALPGTALGDALGLPAEGMSARAVARRFGRLDRFRLLGSTGFVSDDSEQAALVAQSLARHSDDVDRCVRAFRRSLLGWFCRLPWGVGLATVRSCHRIGIGLSPSGVMSAGNGAAMRSAIVGAFFHDRPEGRREFGRALAEVTYRGIRAVEGALYVAEFTAACTRCLQVADLGACQDQARRIVSDPQLGEAIDRAGDWPWPVRPRPRRPESAAHRASSFIPWRSPPSASCGTGTPRGPGRGGLCRRGQRLDRRHPGRLAGGDARGVGAARRPDPPDPRRAVRPDHLRALAACLGEVRDGKPCLMPTYSAPAAMARNLALYPVILRHRFRRLMPF